MSVQMNIVEAKAKLSELVSRAEAGEEIIISRDGKPAVRLVPASAAPVHRRLGALAHLGPLQSPHALLEPDYAIDDLLDAPIWPSAAAPK